MNLYRSSVKAGFLISRVAAGLLSSLALVYFFSLIDRGFDLTDESYYLLWVERPDLYSLSGFTTFFGHVLSPVYHLLGNDPARFRLFGFVVAALASCLVIALVLAQTQGPQTERKERLSTMILLLCSAAATGTFYVWWLPTPSYNWIPLPASFLLIAAMLLLSEGRNLWSAGLAAVSGLLAFAAKPTTGVAFLLVYLIGILLLLGFSRRALVHILRSGIYVIVVALLGAVTIVKPVLIIQQLKSFFEFFGANPAGWQLWFVGWGSLTPFHFALACAIGSLYLKRPIAKLLGAAALLLLVFAIFRYKGIPYTHTQGILVSTGSFAAISNSFAWAPHRPRLHRDKVQILLLSAALLPWAMSFGTMNDISVQTAFYVSVPAVVALAIAWMCFGSRDWRPMAIGCSVALAAGLAIQWAAAHPYRLSAPLERNTEPIRAGGGALRVDPAMAAFVKGLRRDAALARFKAGTIILDFTGDSPGVAYILNGRPPVIPWLAGGYSWSEALGVRVVSRLSENERRSAWLLHSDAPRPFDTTFIRRLGFKLEDYELVSARDHPVHKTPIRLYAPREPLLGARAQGIAEHPSLSA